jgi:hypothetical protein
LRNQAIPILHNGIAREVTITDEDIRSAFAVMKDWATLSLKTLEAEFPAWHLYSLALMYFSSQGRLQERRKGKGQRMLW